MTMVYQSLHNITRIELTKTEQLEKNVGFNYTRKMRFFGYKGHLSKDKGTFEFLELTLFSESKKELEIINF